MEKRRSYFSHMLLLSVATLLCLHSCISDDEDTDMVNYVKVGDMIPDFQITEEDGKTFHSADLKGKISVVVFFYTECGDCERELPIINQAWERLKNIPDVELITIARGQAVKDTEPYWIKEGFTMPRLHDRDRKVFELFANISVPRLYIADRDRVVRWMAIETFNLSADQLVEKVIALDKES